MSWLEIGLWSLAAIVVLCLFFMFVGSKIDDDYPGYW